MNKLVTSSLATLVLAAVPSIAFAATTSNTAVNQVPLSQTQASVSATSTSGFTPERKLTSAQLKSIESQAIVESGQMQSSSTKGSLASQLAATITSPLWSYTNLDPTSFIDTKDTYTVSSTETVWLNAVQYNGGSDMKVEYQLINLSGGPNSYIVTIPGNYTNPPCYVYFNNTAPGTYMLEITNPTTDNIIDGNGYTHY